jgi:hypothetical protein
MKTFLGIPKTVEEAVDQILSGWSKEEAISFKSLSTNDLFDLHNSLGADIRNVFSLWYGNDELLNDCEKYLLQYKEFYDNALWKKEEIEQGKKRIASFDFFSEAEDDKEDVIDDLDDDLLPLSIEDSLDSLKTDSTVPIDPFIASQVIIFAVWNHLQVHSPTL